MDPNSGLLDMFEAKGAVTKTGNKLEYVDKATGEVIKLFRKQWEKNHEGCLDTVRAQWQEAVVSDDDQDDQDQVTDQATEEAVEESV
jgi:hypothetical protein